MTTSNPPAPTAPERRRAPDGRSVDLVAVLELVRDLGTIGALLGASAFFASAGLTDLATGCAMGTLGIIVPRPRAVPPHLLVLGLGIGGALAAHMVLA